MSTAGPVGEDRTQRLASRLATAEFVSLRCRADGDALAATGILAQALGAIDTPFQATVRRPENDRGTRTDADLVVRIGLDGSEGPDDPSGSSGSGDTDERIVLPSEPTPASLAAVAVARELSADPDLVLALAGGVAAAVRDARDPFGGDSCDSGGNEEKERSPDSSPVESLDTLYDRAHDDGRLGDRRPGVALPTIAVVDGLAHTTLAHTTVSGDVEATRERCGSLEERENGREIGSLLALSVVGTEDAAPRAARAVERALRPTSLPGPSPLFATLEGYADVLGAVATERPGIGLALACGYDVRETALSTWRTHARKAHVALRTATRSRYDGLCVARLADGSSDVATDAEGADHGDDRGRDGESNDEGDVRTSVATIARLFRDFRSPEPVALVVGDGIGAIAATENRTLGSVAARVAHDLDGTGGGTERLGEVRFDGSPDELVAAIRTALVDGGRL